MAKVPTSNIICRYFLENTCRASDNCIFSHDVRVGVLDDVCRNYKIHGRCRYGRQCSYDHVRLRPDGSTELVSRGKKSLERDISRILNPPEKSLVSQSIPPALLPLCKEYETAGKCTSKECSAVHGGFCKSCEKYVIHPHNRYFNLVHESQCKSQEATVPTLATYLLSQSADLMCTICLDTVYEKPGKGSKRFGILSSCPHILCLQCAKMWRKVKRDKSCPECRTISTEMKPSVFHVRNGEVKELLFPKAPESPEKLKASRHAMEWPALPVPTVQPIPHAPPVQSIPYVPPVQPPPVVHSLPSFYDIASYYTPVNNPRKGYAMLRKAMLSARKQSDE